MTHCLWDWEPLAQKTSEPTSHLCVNFSGRYGYAFQYGQWTLLRRWLLKASCTLWNEINPLLQTWRKKLQLSLPQISGHFLFYLYLCAFRDVCMHACLWSNCTPRVFRYPWTPEESFGSLGLGVIGSCELSDVGSEINLGPPEYQVLLATGISSLAPFLFISDVTWLLTTNIWVTATFENIHENSFCTF